jgi:CheY-like chemotaxis protein
MNAQPVPRKRRVLLIDDHPDGLMMNTLFIRSLGHEVQIAETGLAAEELVRSFRPDLVFVDLVLPDIDGCDLARGLASKLGGGAKIYILTGYDDVDARQRARKLGARITSSSRSTRRCWSACSRKHAARLRVNPIGHFGGRLRSFDALSAASVSSMDF